MCARISQSGGRDGRERETYVGSGNGDDSPGPDDATGRRDQGEEGSQDSICFLQLVKFNEGV